MPADPEPLWSRLVSEAQTAFRLEAQPFYASDLETGDPQRWRDGDPTPPSWLVDFAADVLEPARMEGRDRVRVRVVDDPMTWVQEWSEWCAETINRPAGETIHVITRAEFWGLCYFDIPRIINEDFWLIDDTYLIIMFFDGIGRLTAVERSEEPGYMQYARTIRDLITETAPAR